MINTDLHSGNRLKLFLLAAPDWNAKRLAAELGTTGPNISAWQKNGVPKKRLAEVSNALGVAIEWLEHGDGPMPEEASIGSVRAAFALSGMSKEELARYFKVSRLTIYTYETKDFVPEDKQFLLDALVESNKRLLGRAITHEEPVAAEANSEYRKEVILKLTMPDNSMAPTIGAGFELTVDTKDTELRHNKIFAIESPAGFLVRRLVVGIKSLTLVSDDGSASDVITPADQVAVIGRVTHIAGEV